VPDLAEPVVFVAAHLELGARVADVADLAER
jgi:hypothetical protein